MPAYQLERIFPSLKFDQPVECVAMPGKGGWMWVVELRGAIHAFQAHDAELLPAFGRSTQGNDSGRC